MNIVHIFAYTSIKTSKNMKKKEEKKEIAPILRNMKVDEIEQWDIVRLTSVNDAVHRIQIDSDKKFTRRINFTHVQVKRLK